MEWFCELLKEKTENQRWSQHWMFHPGRCQLEVERQSHTEHLSSLNEKQTISRYGPNRHCSYVAPPWTLRKWRGQKGPVMKVALRRRQNNSANPRHKSLLERLVLRNHKKPLKKWRCIGPSYKSPHHPQATKKGVEEETTARMLSKEKKG